MGQTDAGFTAVEIMMVVAIAGIVAAVSVPSIWGSHPSRAGTWGSIGIAR